MSETTEDVRLCMHGNGNRAMCQLCILEDFQMRTPAEFAFALAAARREVETVTQRAIRAEADLATSRAALEDVLWQEAHPNVEVVSRRRAEDDEKLWVAYDRSGNVNDTEWFAIAEGDTWKEALRNARRALAQEAGDAK